MLVYYNFFLDEKVIKKSRLNDASARILADLGLALKPASARPSAASRLCRLAVSPGSPTCAKHRSSSSAKIVFLMKNRSAALRSKNPTYEVMHSPPRIRIILVNFVECRCGRDWEEHCDAIVLRKQTGTT